MYIKLNFTNTVPWAFVFATIKNILANNITSVSDLTAGNNSPTQSIQTIAGVSLTLNTNTFTSTNTLFASTITAGSIITGNNIPVNTVISSIAPNTPTAGTYTITMNNNATLTTTSSLSFYAPASGTYVGLGGSGTSGSASLTITPNSSVATGQQVFGLGVPYSTYVTNYNNGTGVVTLSNNLTANAAGAYLFVATQFNDFSFVDQTSRGYFDPNTSEIYRTQSPGCGYGSSTPWCYSYFPTAVPFVPSSTTITSAPFQDLVFQRAVSTSPSTKYYVRLRFDGLHLNLTPYKTCSNDTWITSPQSAGAYFYTQSSLSNGSENCIGYNMRGGCTSFFMYMTPYAILVGGKGPTGSFIDKGWLTTTNRLYSATFANATATIEGVARPYIQYNTSGTGVTGAFVVPSNQTAVTTGTPTAWDGPSGWADYSYGRGFQGSYVTITAAPTTNIRGWQVSGNGIPNNTFVYDYTTTAPYNIYLIGGSPSQAGGPVPSTTPTSTTLTFTHPANALYNVMPEGSRFSVANYTPSTGSAYTASGIYYYGRQSVASASTFSYSEPLVGNNQISRVGAQANNTTGEIGLAALRRASTWLQGASALNTTATGVYIDGYYPHNPNSDAVSLYSGQAHFGPAFISEYVPYDAAATINNNNIPIIFNSGYFQAWDLTANQASLSNVTCTNTSGTNLLTGITANASGNTDILVGMLVTGTGIQPNTTVVSVVIATTGTNPIIANPANPGTVNVTLSLPTTQAVTTVTFNSGTVPSNLRGATKGWFGMSAQDFLWGDPNHVSSSYKVLNLRKTTPNLTGTWSQDTLYAPVYPGTDIRTIERAPLGDQNIGTVVVNGTSPNLVATPAPVVSDRVIAPALTDQPGNKFPDSSKNSAYGLFPIVWSNSQYSMAGGKLNPVTLSGFMLFNGDYQPDDYFTYTPTGGSSASYAIWPMADGYTRRLGIAVPKV